MILIFSKLSHRFIIIHHIKLVWFVYLDVKYREGGMVLGIEIVIVENIHYYTLMMTLQKSLESMCGVDQQETRYGGGCPIHSG